MILKIHKLIPKQENDFQTKEVIDQVCKVHDKNNINTFFELPLKG
jgi:hypothetical protein